MAIAEAVQVAVHQRKGATLRERVLGGDGRMGRGEWGQEGLAVDADLLFFHRLEESQTGSGRSAVEFVDEHHMGEYWPGSGTPSCSSQVSTPDAGHIRGSDTPARRSRPARLVGSGRYPVADSRDILGMAGGRRKARRPRHITAPCVPGRTWQEVANQGLTELDEHIEVNELADTIAGALVSSPVRTNLNPFIPPSALFRTAGNFICRC